VAKQIKSGWLFLLLFISVMSAPGALNAAAKAKPAIVLAAFPSSAGEKT
jgi:hypothetical protein